MKAGQKILITATVLRVDDDLIHAQTADGQLIQTKNSNVMDRFIKKKMESLPDHKAVLNAPEDKSVKRKKNRK